VAEPAPAVLAPGMAAQIDHRAEEVLSHTGVPSASIAIVRDGRVVYAKAYGAARLDPWLKATPQTRYAIGSVSKEFTAAVLLMLAEDGKLSLDDPVGRYVSGLTDGDRITLRQLLDMTAGYQDFWPQDYVPPDMLKPVTAKAVEDRWAKIGLDYPAGSDWQYSNTAYLIAGQAAEKASGQPLWSLIDARILKPLGLRAANVDLAALKAPDARGYTRFALGPVRPAVKEGRGWLYAMGWLALTPSDLARWDISVMDRSLMKAASYDQMEADTPLSDGLFIKTDHDHRMFEHDGEVSGFLAENRIYPDQRSAIVVLTNADFGGADGTIADRIADLLFPAAPADTTSAARAMFDDLRAGRIDLGKLTANARAYFTPQAIHDFAAGLGPLGEPSGFTRTSNRLRGGMTSENYLVTYRNGTRLKIVRRAMPDGRVEQFMVSKVD
jgi:D-alanyl-D-alanine carboxypeptidase